METQSQSTSPLFDITEEDIATLREAQQKINDFGQLIQKRYRQFQELVNPDQNAGSISTRVKDPTTTVICVNADGKEFSCYVLEEFIGGYRDTPKNRYVPVEFVHNPGAYSAEYHRAQKVLNRFSNLTPPVVPTRRV